MDASVLRKQMGDAAAVFQVGDRPMHGFSVEGLSMGWELVRVLHEGRVRYSATYATCTVGELRAMGCDVLATFGTNPPHFTVLVGDDRETLDRVAALLRRRFRPNPHRVSP